ncbi:DUF2382 domain-containing protein [Paracoccus sp. S-4012]|nr:DUF2382 domain-containing protein [Paracoccus sp. S-4012]
MPGTAAGRGVDRAAGALDPDGVDEGLPGTAVGRGIDRAAGALNPDLDRTDAALAGERTYDLEGGGTIDVAEERLHIAKRERDLGRVRVRSYVREIPVDESVHLREERVSIERRPVDRDATEADFRDQSIEAREYAEEAVVSKDARVVEEVALRSETESHEHEVHDTVRKTEVEVVDERDETLKPGGIPRDPNRI